MVEKVKEQHNAVKFVGRYGVRPHGMWSGNSTNSHSVCSALQALFTLVKDGMHLAISL